MTKFFISAKLFLKIVHNTVNGSDQTSLEIVYWFKLDVVPKDFSEPISDLFGSVKSSVTTLNSKVYFLQIKDIYCHVAYSNDEFAFGQNGNMWLRLYMPILCYEIYTPEECKVTSRFFSMKKCHVHCNTLSQSRLTDVSGWEQWHIGIGNSPFELKKYLVAVKQWGWKPQNKTQM